MNAVPDFQRDWPRSLDDLEAMLEEAWQDGFDAASNEAGNDDYEAGRRDQQREDQAYYEPIIAKLRLPPWELKNVWR